MKRFFGLMPRSEVALIKDYKDSLGLEIRIEVGIHGYTIVYADSSTEYEDIDDTVENNLKRALDKVDSHGLEISEVDPNIGGDIIEEI